MDSLCHPWFTTTNLSYRFPIFETSAHRLVRYYWYNIIKHCLLHICFKKIILGSSVCFAWSLKIQQHCFQWIHSLATLWLRWTWSEGLCFSSLWVPDSLAQGCSMLNVSALFELKKFEMHWDALCHFASRQKLAGFFPCVKSCHMLSPISHLSHAFQNWLFRSSGCLLQLHWLRHKPRCTQHLPAPSNSQHLPARFSTASQMSQVRKHSLLDFWTSHYAECKKATSGS